MFVSDSLTRSLSINSHMAVGDSPPLSLSFLIRERKRSLQGCCEDYIVWLEAYAEQKGALTGDLRGVFSLLPCEKHHTPRVGESEMAWEEKKNDHAMSPPKGAKITSWRDQNLAMQEGEGSYISQGFVAPQRTMVRNMV